MGKSAGFLHHFAQHSTDPVALFCKSAEDGLAQVAVGEGSTDPMAGFLQLAIRVRQFACEMRRVTAFCPPFGQVGSNRSRGSTDLIGPRMEFFLRKTFRHGKDRKIEFAAFAVHPQVCERSDSFAHIRQ